MDRTIISKYDAWVAERQVIVWYWRHYSLHTHEASTLEEAINFVWYATSDGAMALQSIEVVGGKAFSYAEIQRSPIWLALEEKEEAQRTNQALHVPRHQIQLRSPDRLMWTCVFSHEDEKFVQEQAKFWVRHLGEDRVMVKVIT